MPPTNQPRPTCGTCKHFNADYEDAEGLWKGECRLRAPVAYTGTEAPGNAIWPWVDSKRWCGEHTPADTYPVVFQHEETGRTTTVCDAEHAARMGPRWHRTGAPADEEETSGE